MGPQFLFNMGGGCISSQTSPQNLQFYPEFTVPGSHNEGVTPRTGCPDACFLPGCKFTIFSSASFSLVCLLLEGSYGLPLKAVPTISKSAQLPFLRSTCPAARSTVFSEIGPIPSMFTRRKVRYMEGYCILVTFI